MQFTHIRNNIQKLVMDVFQLYPNIYTIVESLDVSGGRALLVGGAVRDLLLEKSVKDLDIEVHGMGIDQVEAILKRFGPVRTVGKQFGVLKIDGIDADWSIPRSDSSGRKPKVTLDPYMNSKEAFSRRDLTINAMGIDLITFQLEDPFNGLHDLENNILRAPDAQKFKEDPLRFFRVMQFVGRLQMQPDKELNDICKNMDLSDVAKERVYLEFEKLFTKSENPSLGIQWLQDIGRLQEILPEVYNTIGIPQDPIWHPEGDVFEHTKQAMDAAAQHKYDSADEKFLMVCGLMCHDLGKAIATQEIDGRIRSIQHDIKGMALAYDLLDRITGKNEVKAIVKKMVKFHMAPGQFIKNGAGHKAYKRLAQKLDPELNCKQLALVAVCDKAGRNPVKGNPLPDKMFPDIQEFIDNAKKYGVITAPEEPILKGRDVIDYIPPGPKMGRALSLAYKLQITKGIRDKEELKIAVIGKKKKRF